MSHNIKIFLILISNYGLRLNRKIWMDAFFHTQRRCRELRKEEESIEFLLRFIPE